MQNCGMAPPFGTWAEGLRTQTVREDRCFGPKIGLNLSEDLFFWSSSNSEQKNTG